MENNTEVVFENIEQRIIQEIRDAHYAIFVSVAWFTNKKLFQALLEKAKNNCYVSIIIQLDEINSQSGIDYGQIQVGRSECLMISKDAELLHDKFCVIDFRKVITGSYNWTYKAAHNSENILILTDPSVATQYITRFEHQKAKYNTSSVQHSSTGMSVFSIVEKAATVQPNTKQCKHCKKEIEYSSNFCKHCGTQQGECNIERSIECKHCSHKQVDPMIDGYTFYCTHCGKQVVQKQEKTKTCPICLNTSEEWKYCPSCGLPKYISSPLVFSSDPLPHYTPLYNARPEFSLFEQYQKCHKCKTPNLFGVNYCRNCGESLSTKAIDRNSHGWVDLGLSVLWSTETMWGFYRWMDTTRFSVGGHNSSFNKPNMKDVAAEYWGRKWRIPTKEEFEELLNKCTWECVFVPNQTESIVMNLESSITGSSYLYGTEEALKRLKDEMKEQPRKIIYEVKKRALKVTGPNGNYILLPTTNCYGPNEDISFWTSTKDVHKERSAFAFKYLLKFSSDEEWIAIPFEKGTPFRRSILQNTALCIRPVVDKKWQGHI